MSQEPSIKLADQVAHMSYIEPSEAQTGLSFERLHTTKGVDPYDSFNWTKVDAIIQGVDDEICFFQSGVEFPASWSQQAINIVASKYFYGQLESDRREFSLKQLVDRVVNTITKAGIAGGYFVSEAASNAFSDDLKFLICDQRFAFNSPVWFNIGTPERQQASACFINNVSDTMDSIMELASTEARIFKWGSGAGVNLSALRGKGEPLSGGGDASGPVSFMRGYDSFAGVIKSGGKKRRAAKMIVLDVDHPDIEEFVSSKVTEEKKAKALIAAGYDPGFAVDGGAYDSVFFQNANHSIRISDRFMEAVSQDEEWELVWRGEHDRPPKTVQARVLMQSIAQAAWGCGDPGIQYDDTIHRWHTAKAAGRQTATNPCSEYLFLSDTACNLASINLLRYFVDREFQVEEFQHAARLSITAQDILVDHADYPTEKIAAETRRWRTLGLGYSNLGASLMTQGMPYDSDEGRAFASAVTSLMSATAYEQSAAIAKVLGPFSGHDVNDTSLIEVIRLHRDQSGTLPQHPIADVAYATWVKACKDAVDGVRNAQVTVLAPTGTISFMMDCQTTGVEPELALVKHKTLVGGGVFKMVNNTVRQALWNLDYSEEDCDSIIEYIDLTGGVDGCPALDAADLPVFDTSFGGDRVISWEGHIKMMAAIQPFISGAISKTINMPSTATVQDVEHAYQLGWKLGLKALAIYRDGCKQSQPLSTTADEAVVAPVESARARLPETRNARTHKFDIGGHEGYITAGLYENGALGEIFVVMSKTGSTINGLIDAFATSISINLQYGVPLRVLCQKFKHMRFEPSGFTQNPDIMITGSVIDYIFRWLEQEFLDVSPPSAPDGLQVRLPGPVAESSEVSMDAPHCLECGSLTVRAGTCYSCANCGATTGCG